MTTLTAEEIKYQQDHKDQNKTAHLVAANVVGLVAAYVAVALRLISRRMSHAALKADDWMMMVGLVKDSFLSCFRSLGDFLNGESCFVGIGKTRNSTYEASAIRSSMAVLATEVLYTPASTSIKFSILLLYRRIFPSKTLKIVLQCISVFLVIFALAQMLSVIIQCTPVAALWNPADYPDATCDNYAPALILFAAVNATTDIIILCLPMPLLWRLHVSLSDPSWDDVNTVILSSVENCAGVVSACLPTMLPIARVFRHGIRVSGTSKSSPASTYRKGLKLTSLKTTLWSETGNCEPNQRGASFARLQHPSDDQHLGDELETPTPNHQQNIITVTTELKQTRGAAPHKIASTNGYLST
ncbi:hypothetical protein MMC22_003402 [Lobaria immixta]|nr:hypothetical protein [Lobaria immixta]